MKKFKFNLEYLYNIRKRKEEEEKRKFLEIYKPYGELVGKRNILKQKLSNNSQIDVKDINAYLESNRLSQTILSHINTIEKEMEALKPTIDAAREEYNKARREKRIIEIMKEKAWKKYLDEMRKEEQAELDEIAMNLYRRKDETW